MSTSHRGLEHPQIQEPTEALDAIPWVPSDNCRRDHFKHDSAGNRHEYMRVWSERVRLWLTKHINGDSSQGHIEKCGSWKTHPTHQQSPHKVQPPRGHLAELQQCFGIQRTATERSQTRSQWAGKATHSLTDTGQSQNPRILNRQHLEIQSAAGHEFPNIFRGRRKGQHRPLTGLQTGATLNM